MLQKFIAMMRNEEGQGLVEYALIILLISIVCVIALTAVGSGVNSVYVNLSALL
jgi:pilus assembly protein Flp/PilA